jgi:hypothetical protein
LPEPSAHPAALRHCIERSGAKPVTGSPASAYLLYKGDRFSAAFPLVKGLFTIPFLLLFLVAAQAQDQEGKLMNRLLRPDTTLANSAQNKTFNGSASASVNKPARIGTFYMERKPTTKPYSNTWSFSAANSFHSETFDTSGTGNSLLASRSAVRENTYETPKARVSVELRDSHKQAGSRNYAGNRPFLEKGKSQKSFDRKNAPMTIEQVRELLNKNK